MRPELEALIASQGGIFKREQALACGISEREFRSLVRPTGPWRRVRYAVYTPRELWDRLDDNSRARLRDRAALLVCNDTAVLSHSSAARLHGLDLYAVGDGLTHVTRLGPGLSNRIESAIKHHGGVLTSDEVLLEQGVRAVTLARAVMGVTCEFGYASGLVAADSALRAGLDRQILVDLAARLAHHPGAAAMRAVAEDADGRAETPIETLARIMLVKMGITDLVPQFTIHLRQGRRAEVDLYSPELRHAFETDGRLKYVNQVDRFGRELTADDVVWMEKKREDEVRAQNVGVSRLYWWHVQPDAFQRTSARLWQEIQDQAAARRLPPSA